MSLIANPTKPLSTHPEANPSLDGHFDVSVYYEDTDCMGIVYHANYLKFMERARTELLNSVGPSVREWSEMGYIFPIYSVQITFRTAARLGDTLHITTKWRRLSPFRFTFDQRIERPSDGKLVVEATVEVVCTDLHGQLREYPDLAQPGACDSGVGKDGKSGNANAVM